MFNKLFFQSKQISREVLWCEQTWKAESKKFHAFAWSKISNSEPNFSTIGEVEITESFDVIYSIQESSFIKKLISFLINQNKKGNK
jgi:hypothetical protein